MEKYEHKKYEKKIIFNLDFHTTIITLMIQLYIEPVVHLTIHDSLVLIVAKTCQSRNINTNVEQSLTLKDHKKANPNRKFELCMRVIRLSISNGLEI